MYKPNSFFWIGNCKFLIIIGLAVGNNDCASRRKGDLFFIFTLR